MKNKRDRFGVVVCLLAFFFLMTGCGTTTPQPTDWEDEHSIVECGDCIVDCSECSIDCGDTVDDGTTVEIPFDGSQYPLFDGYGETGFFAGYRYHFDSEEINFLFLSWSVTSYSGIMVYQFPEFNWENIDSIQVYFNITKRLGCGDGPSANDYLVTAVVGDSIDSIINESLQCELSGDTTNCDPPHLLEVGYGDSMGYLYDSELNEKGGYKSVSIEDFVKSQQFQRHQYLLVIVDGIKPRFCTMPSSGRFASIEYGDESMWPYLEVNYKPMRE